MRYAPAPGSMPTSRQKRKFVRYAAETSAVLAALKAAEAELLGMAELIDACCKGDTNMAMTALEIEAIS